MSSRDADSTLPFDSLSAPAGDGEVLVFPGMSELGRMAEANRARRRAGRVVLLGEAVGSAVGDGPLVVMTGHQPEFLHAGVWVKNVVATRVARGIGGRAESVVVDSDEAADAELRWPEEVGGELVARRLALAAGGTFEQMRARTGAAWREWFGAVPAGMREDRGRAMAGFVEAFVGAEGDYVSRWERGVAAIDRAAGEETPGFLRVSGFEGGAFGEAWRRFVGHAFVNARGLVEHYNAALAAYREARGIRGTRHPIPDLAVEDGRVEIPFWALGDGLPRARVFVARRGDVIELFAGAERMGELGGDAVKWVEAIGRWRIRPRALMLTAFVRLFACDVFIHGLGGAKYDQITDGLIRRFFGVEPAGYGGATATLRLPLPRRDATVGQLAELARAIRDRRFNPQRYLARRDEVVERALRGRDEAIIESGRMREAERDDRAKRRVGFALIRKLNEVLQGHVSAGPTEESLAAVRAGIAHNRIADDREWFVGLHETRRLAELCEGLARVA